MNKIMSTFTSFIEFSTKEKKNHRENDFIVENMDWDFPVFNDGDKKKSIVPR